MKEAWCRVDKFTTSAKGRSSPLAKNGSSKNWTEHARTMQSRISFQDGTKTSMRYIIGPVKPPALGWWDMGAGRKIIGETQQTVCRDWQPRQWNDVAASEHGRWMKLQMQCGVQILQSSYGKYWLQCLSIRHRFAFAWSPLIMFLPDQATMLSAECWPYCWWVLANPGLFDDESYEGPSLPHFFVPRDSLISQLGQTTHMNVSAPPTFTAIDYPPLLDCSVTCNLALVSLPVNAASHERKQCKQITKNIVKLWMICSCDL